MSLGSWNAYSRFLENPPCAQNGLTEKPSHPAQGQNDLHVKVWTELFDNFDQAKHQLKNKEKQVYHYEDAHRNEKAIAHDVVNIAVDVVSEVNKMV